jgi:hypothetical protein
LVNLAQELEESVRRVVLSQKGLGPQAAGLRPGLWAAAHGRHDTAGTEPSYDLHMHGGGEPRELPIEEQQIGWVIAEVVQQVVCVGGFAGGMAQFLGKESKGRSDLRVIVGQKDTHKSLQGDVPLALPLSPGWFRVPSGK